jgi:hypothetical protein
MDEELGFKVGDRYCKNLTLPTVRVPLDMLTRNLAIALLMFFITYFIFEIPSNIVLRKVGAANWLSFLCFSWGVVILGEHALVF